MRKFYTADSIIIRKMKLGEADVRLTAVTLEHGRIIVKAPGLRRITSRRSPYLDLFNYVKMFITAGRTFGIITDIEPFESFNYLREKLNRIGMAYKLSEVCDRLLPENEPYPDIFNRLLISLRMLNKPESDPEKTGDFFCLDLLKRLGFLPREMHLEGTKLNMMLEEIMEKQIKSLTLLTKIGRSLR